MSEPTHRLAPLVRHHRRAARHVGLLGVVAAAVCALVPVGAAAAPAPTHSTPSIINGTQVSDGGFGLGGRWNHLAAVVASGYADTSQAQFCGGSLVAPDWVLTAAHCVWGDYDQNGSQELAPASSMEVVLGRRDLASQSGVKIAVDQVVAHQTYQPGANTDNDIALLHLASSVPSSVAVPIQLVGPADAALWAPGQQLWVGGWGNRTATLCTNGSGCTATGADDYPTSAYEVDVPRVSDAECGNGPAPGYFSFVASGMMCAGVLDTDGAAGTTNGHDSCQGDSGGPLIADPGAGSDARRLVGVVSYGIGCGSTNYGVYARVESFTGWIASTMAGVPSGGGGGPTGGGGGGGTTTGGGDGTTGGGGETGPRGDDGAAPGMPANLRITARTASSLTVEWEEPLEGGEVAGYLVTWTGSDLDAVVDPSEGLEYTIKGLAPGKPVTVSVSAFGLTDEAESLPASVRASTVKDTTKPVAVGAPKLRAAGLGRYTVTWAAARDDHKVGKYKVWLKAGSGAWRAVGTLPAAKRAFLLKNASAGSLVAIQPIDASGNVGARSKAARVPS